MIGYYVHHSGHGHAHRARCLANELGAASSGEPGKQVTGLSSLPRPDGWPGDWVRLPADDRDRDPRDPTARGHLHWAPQHDAGLSARMARIAQWLDVARPSFLVSDVSVEVTLLARLHGVPVVSVVLPGDRGDVAHRLGHGVSDLLVAFWPPEARDLVQGLTIEDEQRLSCLGALSRHPVADREEEPTGGRVVVLGGGGGGGLSATDLERARALTPAWTWEVLGGPTGTWVEDPRPLLLAADVVVTNSGQNAVAEVAAARRPAVVLPQPRPHGEQAATGRVLADGPWPVEVVRGGDDPDWPTLLERCASLDGRQWESWCDGRAASRFVATVLPLLGAGARE